MSLCVYPSELECCQPGLENTNAKLTSGEHGICILNRNLESNKKLRNFSSLCYFISSVKAFFNKMYFDRNTSVKCGKPLICESLSTSNSFNNTVSRGLFQPLGFCDYVTLWTGQKNPNLSMSLGEVPLIQFLCENSHLR